MDAGDRRGLDRLTVQEAARRLDVSEGAVRKRVTRGTLRHEKAPDGRVFVYLDAGVDTGVDEGVNPNNSALISRLEDEIAYLREESRRKDEIIMQQAMTVRQLTAGAPSEARESPAPSAPGPTPPEGSGEAQGATERPEEPRRSWWREFFGFD
jgi:hypothetical protein